MSEIRVRFAPSPTGKVHIGNIRAAIYNWLFARHTGGKFLLRVEDTDLERSTPEAIQVLFDCMKWLGLEGRRPAPRERPRLQGGADFARGQDRRRHHVQDAQGGDDRVRRHRQGPHGEEGGGHPGLRDRPLRRLADLPHRERGGRHRPARHPHHPRRRPRREHLQAHLHLPRARRRGAAVRPPLDDRQPAGEAVLEARRRGVRGRVPRAGVSARGALQLPAAPGLESRRRPRGAVGRCT